MPLKNLKELYVLISALIVGTSQSLADGKFTFVDIGNYVQAFLKGEPAISGIGLIPGELGEANRDDKSDALDDFEASLDGSLDQEDAADITAILGGIQGTIALASRRKKDEMLGKFAALLNSGAVKMDLAVPTIVAADESEWTNEEVEELLGSYLDLL